LDILSEVLVLPELKAKHASKTKPALTRTTVCITDDDALESLRKSWKRKKVRRKQLESRKRKEKEKAEREKEEEKCYH